MQPLDADRFFEAVSDPDTADDLEHRLVTLPIAPDGWDYWNEGVQIRHRSLNGSPGCHLATPVAATSNDNAEPFGVLLVEGWLPQRACTGWLQGEVAVIASRIGAASQITGRVRVSQERGRLGPTDPAQGRLESLARTDVERIDQQTTLDLVPVYLELVSARRASGSRIKLGTGVPGSAVPQPVRGRARRRAAPGLHVPVVQLRRRRHRGLHARAAPPSPQRRLRADRRRRCDLLDRWSPISGRELWPCGRWPRRAWPARWRS